VREMGLFVVLGSLIVACGLREHSSGWKVEEEVVEVVVGWLWGVGIRYISICWDDETVVC
jgi:hypothetical protein